MRLVTCTGHSGLVCEHPTLQGDFGVISGRQDWKERAGQPGAQRGEGCLLCTVLGPGKGVSGQGGSSLLARQALCAVGTLL